MPLEKLHCLKNKASQYCYDIVLSSEPLILRNMQKHLETEREGEKMLLAHTAQKEHLNYSCIIAVSTVDVITWNSL